MITKKLKKTDAALSLWLHKRGIRRDTALVLCMIFAVAIAFAYGGMCIIAYQQHLELKAYKAAYRPMIFLPMKP